MPLINIERVVSCSSEDPKYPAANLLSTDKKKWKCRNVGDKQASVILQLAKQAVINSIDIGNEHSAFVEVLVGNSSSPDEDFEVLLVTSSFMSPMESRDGSNANRVRMFSQDALLKPVSERKWDRVKVVCTQPFNKHIQYGLAFIVLHTLEEKPANISSLGRFALREQDNEDDDKISVGSFFARHKDSSPSLKVAGPAAIRAATSLPPKTGKADILLTSKEKHSDMKPNPGVDIVAARRNKVALDEGEDDNGKVGWKNGGIQRNLSESTSERKKRPAEEQREEKKKLKKENPVTQKQINQSTAGPQKKLFHQLLEGVVFVISGYQNPTRGEIRSKALDMGAKYKADWDNVCTHLVCAFPNTPKFQQVAGKGRIVQKEWIEHCHSQRKKLPWRRYAMEKQEQDKPESEDEIMEQAETNTNKDDDNGDDGGIAGAVESDSDTDDEIQRLQTQNPYNEDTDVDSDEIPQTSSSVLPPLPSVFQNKIFYIHEGIEVEDCKRLKRYIVAYKGTVAPKMDGSVNFVLAAGSASDLNKVKARYPVAVVLHPDWIWACNDASSLVPLDAYKI